MPYELYEKMMEAYKTGINFEAAARNWIEGTANNPFTDKTAHEYFFKAKKYYRNWRNQGIDMRSSRRSMIEMVRLIAEMNLPNPHDINEISALEISKQEEIKKEIKKEKEQNEQLNKEDTRIVMLEMVKSYNADEEENFKQYVIHLMDISEENPFAEGTNEYSKFDEMIKAFHNHNIRRTVVVGKELCEIINNTEIYPEEIKPKKIILKESKKILGVPNEEKKSWFKFLYPRKKEGE